MKFNRPRSKQVQFHTVQTAVYASIKVGGAVIWKFRPLQFGYFCSTFFLFFEWDTSEHVYTMELHYLHVNCHCHYQDQNQVFYLFVGVPFLLINTRSNSRDARGVQWREICVCVDSRWTKKGEDNNKSIELWICVQCMACKPYLKKHGWVDWKEQPGNSNSYVFSWLKPILILSLGEVA